MSNTIISIKPACTGCGVCSYICPNSAIEMKSTFEGFSYPYVDPDKCVMCGKCCEVCPAVKDVEQSEAKWYCFAADDHTRWISAGGGILNALISLARDDETVIYAPIFSKDHLSVKHRKLETADDVSLICGVPYVQSNAHACFPEIKEALEDNKNVLFIGTPCEVEGAKAYLQKEYDNLILVNTACGGAASPFVWEEFVKSREGYSKIKRLDLGSKELYCDESIRINFENAAYQEVKSGDWLTNYHKGLFLRKACYGCKYNLCGSSGDLTIGIYYPVSKNDGKGWSFVGVNSEKGSSLWEKLQQIPNVTTSPIPPDAVEKLKKYFSVPNMPEERQKFLELCYTHGFNKALKTINGKPDDTGFTKKYILDYHAGDPLPWKILDPVVWTKREFDSELYLLSNGDKWKRIFLPLNCTLKMSTQYHYNLKLKMKTDAQEVRLMFAEKAEADSVCPLLHKIRAYQNDTWMIISGTYIPTTDILKYFMLTSTDFTGKDPYICFDWIRIREE